jgi:predicted transcriptional regulator
LPNLGSGSSRERIFAYILANPGCHFRRIVRELHLNVGVVQYFTNKMERHGEIWSDRGRVFRRYYAKEKIVIPR